MNLTDRIKPDSLNSGPREMQKIQDSENTKKQSELIQTLSSENSTLRSKLREKSGTIVSLNEEITRLNDMLGMLSSADLILKENERLERSNEELKRKADTAMQEASTSISVTKREYREKKAELQSKINAAAKREQDAQNMIDNESALIERLAEEKIAEEKRIVQQKCDVTLNKYKQYFNKRMKQLKQDYDIKFDSLNVFAVGGPLICVLMTVLTAIHSKRFSSDFAGFFKAIGYSLMDMCRDFEKGSLGGKVFALIAIIICIGIVCVITYGAVEIIKHYMADGISIFVALVSMIVIVWFADDMSSVSMNLIGLYLLINVGYIVARMIYIAIRNDF